MKQLVFLLCLIAFISAESNSQPTDFYTSQQKYPRVRNAISEKEGDLREDLNKVRIRFDKLNLLLIAYKKEGILEVFAKENHQASYKLFKSYEICMTSGGLGPKRKQGDYQVPEGYYHIDRFNPVSNFHLSLGLNYPNQSDRLKSNHSKLGGDIFIHGSCVTIGCLPITDKFIKELYLLAIRAKGNGQNKIPVYVYPFKMADKKFKENINGLYPDDLISFWKNLKVGYDKFTTDRQEVNFRINRNGDYVFDGK